jgi:outer membrane lipoprotein carrier protein
MTHLALLFVLAAAPNAAAPKAPAPQASAPVADVATVVDRMQKKYDEAKDFRAHFTQKFTRKAFARALISEGDVLIKKPGKMRWNYKKPEEQMYLSNGQTLWVYQPEDAQVIKQDLKTSQLPAALAFLTGKGKLTTEFDVKLAPQIPYGAPGLIKLSLTPKRPQSAYQAIYFLVDPKDYLVRESVLVDVQGSVNHFVFTDVAVNTKIADAVFKWTRPANVREIDVGKLSSGG